MSNSSLRHCGNKRSQNVVIITPKPFFPRDVILFYIYLTILSQEQFDRLLGNVA